jgi:hypothetical protein
MRVILFVVGGVLIGVGVWLMPRFMNNVKFEGFPGVYICEDFGMPDKEHNTIQIDQDLNVAGIKGQEMVTIGKLKPIDNSKNRARIDLSMELVHSPSFSLDPFAEHVAEGVGNSLVLSATRDGKLLYSQPCFRK